MTDTVDLGGLPTTNIMRFQNVDQQRFVILWNMRDGTVFESRLTDTDGNLIPAPLPKPRADTELRIPEPYAPRHCWVISFAGVPVGKYVYTLITNPPTGQQRIDEIRIEVLSDAETAAVNARRHTPVSEPVPFEG